MRARKAESVSPHAIKQRR